MAELDAAKAALSEYETKIVEYEGGCKKNLSVSFHLFRNCFESEPAEDDRRAGEGAGGDRCGVNNANALEA